MISELFTISASNIGHEAMRTAGKSSGRQNLRDTPATIKLASHADAGDDELYVEVRSSRGFAQDIRIGRAKVHALLRIQGHEATRAACQAYIDDRAEQIRVALMEARTQGASYNDGHLDVGGDGYTVGSTSTPEEQARAFVKRPSMFIGNPATLDRVLAYLHGFEAAMQTSHDRQPQLHEYSDLIQEIEQALGSDPTDDQQLEAIDALEPILAQVYRAAQRVRESSTGSL